MLQRCSIRQVILRHQIPVDDRIIHITDIVCTVTIRSVCIRPRQAALNYIFVKELCRILFIHIIPAELCKTEREDMDLYEPSSK